MPHFRIPVAANLVFPLLLSLTCSRGAEIDETNLKMDQEAVKVPKMLKKTSEIVGFPCVSSYLNGVFQGDMLLPDPFVLI